MENTVENMQLSRNDGNTMLGEPKAVPLVCGNRKLELSDNVHPCANGEPWGWVKVAGTSLRVATYSGRKEKEMCRNLVDAYNLLLKQTNGA